MDGSRVEDQKVESVICAPRSSRRSSHDLDEPDYGVGFMDLAVIEQVRNSDTELQAITDEYRQIWADRQDIRRYMHACRCRKTPRCPKKVQMLAYSQSTSHGWSPTRRN